MSTSFRFGVVARAALLSSAAAISLQGANQAYAQVVQDRYLSRVQANEHGDCATVTVQFNVPVQYQSHFPESGGQDLRISVQPLNFNRFTLGSQDGSESARPPSSDIAGIQQVTYDLFDPSGPTLTLQFDHEVNWTVESDNDVTKIVILVSGAGASGCSAEVGQGPTGADQVALARSILSVTQVVPETFDTNGFYAINLASTRGDKLDPAEVKRVGAFSDYVGYTYVAEENGATWARLRLGAFGTRADAEAVLATLSSEYPDAWIVRLDRRERDFVYRAWTAARAILSGGQVSAAPQLPLDPQAENLLKEARQKYSEEDYPEVVRLTSSIQRMPENSASPAAQELLGLAREKAGQLAHAKAEYEAFLQKYPNDPAAERVRQRLAVLVTGEAAPGSVVAADGTIREEPKIHSSVTGSLSALYQRDESGFLFQDSPVVGGSEVNPDPIETNQVNLNEMLYGADLNLSLGTDRNEATFRFSGLYRDDFNTDPRDDTSISSLYLDLSDRKLDASLRLGRQTRNTGGVFGRFDGAYGGMQLNDRVKINGVAGFPVQSSRDVYIGNDRQFFATSLDVSIVPDVLDTTVYVLDQTYGDLKDRQAAGFEFRYFQGNRTAYGVFDYDMHYGQMNLALLNGTLRFKDESSVTVAVDYRRSPFLTTQNAIFGQMVTDPNQLLDTYTEDEIYQIAEDRTAYSRSAYVSLARPLTKKLQINFDVIASNVSGTKTSAGVEAQPPTGTEVYYSTQLVASDVFKQGAIAIFGVRYADLATATQVSYQFNGRLPVTRSLRISPRLRIDDRNSSDGTFSRTSGRGSLAATWSPKRMLQFEFEGGGVYSDSANTLSTSEERGYFLSIGVRKDF
ncbi:SPOR domain-containing protein [Hyphomonas sp.]|uniref:SPOR domain-containing protein n=1 Tax=Hyphomonas sp. TaxID=87 RepID=UPI003529D0FA